MVSYHIFCTFYLHKYFEAPLFHHSSHTSRCTIAIGERHLGLHHQRIDMNTNNNSNRYYSLRSGGRTSSAKNDDDRAGVGGNDRSSISNNEDPPLSEYELLRLRNIQRNEARLLALGLIHNVPTATKSSEEQTKTKSSNKENQRKKNGIINDDTKSLIPLRNLPKRSCATRRTSTDTTNDNDDNNDGYESPPPSPIELKRVLTLQPHQMEVDEAEAHLPVYKRTRRERRGRPRLEDYTYVCDEICSHCGGEWKLNGDNEEEEEETRLFRCKDCRGAFHMQCMLVHGKTDDDEVKEHGEDDVASGGGEKVEELQKEDGERNEDYIVPKRCFQCECNKNKRRHVFVPTLDAVIADKEVSVRITPQPSLEAIVNKKNVTCCIMFNSEQF
jgi:hypothetical protein